MLFDAFISHAGEDKTDLVRPLAHRLREHHLSIWYDEFTLRAGDSLRRSIDLGLAKSRYGIVVLSPHFFRKQWPQWELDGLVTRQMSGSRNVLIPIWHEIEREGVAAYSPSLADRVAIRSGDGLDHVVEEILKVLRPQGSTLLIARDRMIDFGLEPPVVTDDWWLDVAEHSATNDAEGTFQEAMGWGRWGFPLPERSEVPAERGERLAWAGMQMLWQREAEARPITQVTHPDLVHEFIDSQPGLFERASEFPWYVAAYAPQLTIPGFGGAFEPYFEAWYENSVEQQAKKREERSNAGSALTLNGLAPACTEAVALRHPTFGDYEPAMIAGNYVMCDMMGPPTQFYDVIDYAAWLLSAASDWLPRHIHAYLLAGMQAWAVWPWSNGLSSYTDFNGSDAAGSLSERLHAARSYKTFKLTRAARADLTERLEFSSRLLRLPESGAELAERMIAEGFIESWFANRDERRRRRKRSKTPS